jgi:BTB/POZ domain-containing protein 7
MRCVQHGLITDMDECLLIDVLRSDYVQAGELDILQTVLKWGEHALCRRMEEREPNILSGECTQLS